MLMRIWDFLIRTSYIWKVALAAGVSWDLAEVLGLQHPYFAPLAAILCLQVTVAASVARSLERTVGIVGGVILADLTAQVLGLHGWSIALLVVVGLSAARLFRLHATAVPQVAVSALMVLAAGPNHLGYSFDRVVNTLIGAAVAVVVNLLVLPADYSDEAQEAVHAAADELATRFTRIAEWLRAGADVAQGRRLQDDTRGYVDTLHRTMEQGERALEAVSFSLVAGRRRHRLMFLHTALLHLRQGYAHATGIVRTCLEWQEEGDGMPQDEQLHWAERLEEAARWVPAWALRVTSRSEGESSSRNLASSSADSAPSRIPPNLEAFVTDPGSLYDGALWNDLRQLAEEMVFDPATEEQFVTPPPVLK